MTKFIANMLVDIIITLRNKEPFSFSRPSSQHHVKDDFSHAGWETGAI